MRRLPQLAEYCLKVATAAPAAPVCMQVDLAGASGQYSPGLEWLGGDLEQELWCAPAHQVACLAYSAADDPEVDPAPLAERLYRQLIRDLRDSEFGYPLRLWNYFPGINRGAGDAERYRQFCVGRGRALEAAGLADAQMCAATAIGGDAPVMRLIALAGRHPGVSIENPRQVSAWNYPRAYGPRSPAFARATAIGLENGGAGLLVSGTASVVGHATAHIGNVAAQTAEAASNLEALLENGAAQLRRPALGRPGGQTLVRVYVRNPADWPEVESILRARWPGVQMAGLKGEICRTDLLMEIEAWHPAA